MKKSELRKIIKNSIVELMTEKKVSKTKRGGDPCACSSDSDCKDAVASGCNGNKCRDSKCVADGNKTKDLREKVTGYVDGDINKPICSCNGVNWTNCGAGCACCDNVDPSDYPGATKMVKGMADLATRGTNNNINNKK